MKLRIPATALAAILLAAGPALAQDAEDQGGESFAVVGQVVDHATDVQVPRADISFRPIPEGRVLASVDEAGAPVWEGSAGVAGVFRTAPMAPGVYLVRLQAEGYERATTFVDLPPGGTAPLELKMVPVAYVLDPIMVTVERQIRLEEVGFFERRRAGVGYAFDREQIEARAPPRVSDLLAGIPGVRVVSGGPGSANTVRLRNDCVPQVIMDGAPFAFPIALDELVNVYELEAIEVYHGSAGPVQTLRDSCGTVMVWTRSPASMENARPFSWTRAIAWGSLAAIPFLVLR